MSRDADGYYFIVGRTRDQIICGGAKIAPIEVEDALLTHPGIAAAAVVGSPVPVYGQVVKGGDRKGGFIAVGGRCSHVLLRADRRIQSIAHHHLHGCATHCAVGEDSQNCTGIKVVVSVVSDTGARIRGALAGLAAATIWSAWYVHAWHGVTAGGMNTYDLAALRFLVATPLLMLILRLAPSAQVTARYQSNWCGTSLCHRGRQWLSVGSGEFRRCHDRRVRGSAQPGRWQVHPA
ncbi:hypothetical protein LOS78_11490 [Paracoccus sp. MA]|nr:hypothetical protein LOS78_11490 [Paracoccus sp. MA]